MTILRSIAFFLFLSVWPQALYAESYFITNARLYGEEGATVSLLLESGVISALGPKVVASPGAVHIDAEGAVVTPGLMNSATNLGVLELHSVKETADYNGAANKLEADFDIQFGLNANSVLLDTARSEGLTRAAALPSGADNIFAGQGALLHLVEGTDILDRPSAVLVVEAGGKGAGDKSRSAVWVDLYKAFNKAKKEDEDADAQTKGTMDPLESVLAGRMPLLIKADRESDLRQAVMFSEKTDVRVIILGGAEAWRVAADLAAAKIAVILNPYDILPNTFDSIGARADNAALLQDAGVLISFSVSSVFKSHNAGIALRIGAGYAASNGLDRQAALDAITINPAKMWNIDDAYGALKVGMSADIVLWSGDPLEPMTVAEKIFIGGKPFEHKSRQMQLRDKYHPYKNTAAYSR